MNFPLKILGWAESQPDKAAIVWKGGEFTYRKLNDEVNRFSHALKSLGTGKGDRVAIQLLNCPEFVIGYLAIMKIGAVVVPINPLYKGKDLGDIMSDSGSQIIITSPAFAENIIKLRDSLPALKNMILTQPADGMTEDVLLFDELRNANEPTEFPFSLEDHQLAEIIYTSGTTGFAKGAMLTHRNLYSNAKTYSEIMNCSPEERILIVAPMFHSAAQTCCLTNGFVSGCTSFLLERWTSAKDTVSAMQEWKITFFFGPPTMYTFLLGNSTLRTAKLNLRVAFTGAASLPVHIFKEWREVVGFEIVEGYGLSETAPVVSINPLLGTKKPGSIGREIPEVSVKIFDDNGNELAVGEVGEIVVKGPNVMSGYWKNAEATQQAIKDGWFYTGDMAYMDEEGYIFIVDRKKDMINRGGFKIYPREVEEILYRHPAVLEAAVVGIPEALSGETVKAFIVLKDGMEVKSAALKKFCNAHLASFKVPKAIEFVQALPKTATGKVLKTELRKSL